MSEYVQRMFENHTAFDEGRGKALRAVLWAVGSVIVAIAAAYATEPYWTSYVIFELPKFG
jgi:hypothetical protein